MQLQKEWYKYIYIKVYSTNLKISLNRYKKKTSIKDHLNPSIPNYANY